MSLKTEVGKRQKPTLIAEGVWMWSIDYGDGETFFNSYLLQTDENESIVIDPLFNALDGKPALEWSYFDNLPSPQAVWLTTSDHERDSRLFCKHFHIPLRASKAESKLLSMPIDEDLKDESIINGAWKVFFLKEQKTPAECVFYQTRSQLLIVGDALLSQSDGRLRRPYDEPSYKSEEKAKQGLQFLANLSVKGVLPGHGDPVFKNAQSLLQKALSQDPRVIAR